MTSIATDYKWALDYGGVWHRMSSPLWNPGIGPADPTACCGRLVRSAESSTVHPRDLHDDDGVLCVSSEDVHREATE